MLSYVQTQMWPETEVGYFNVLKKDKPIVYCELWDNYLKGTIRSNFGDLIDLKLPVDIRDWPTLEGKTHLSKMFYRVYRLRHLSISLLDWYAENIMKRQLIKTGVQFVSGYRRIYTTRLHVVILSILLHKEFHFIDNSYDKNSTLYET